MEFPYYFKVSTKGQWGGYGHMKWSEVKSLSCVQLFATPRTVAYKAPLSMECSRQEYWSGSEKAMATQFACYSRYFLTSYFYIQVPYNEKDIFFGC